MEIQAGDVAQSTADLGFPNDIESIEPLQQFHVFAYPEARAEKIKLAFQSPMKVTCARFELFK